MLSFLHLIDISILQLVNLSFHNIILDNIFLMISNMGTIIFWIVISILLYLFGNEKGKKIATKMIIILVITTAITSLVKIIVMRPRPYVELTNLILLDLGTDYSFPSGHTTTSTAMAFTLSKEYHKWIVMIIPLIVAFSRMYIGVHYPSDVLGGFLLGIGIIYLSEYFIDFEKLQKLIGN